MPTLLSSLSRLMRLLPPEWAHDLALFGLKNFNPKIALFDESNRAEKLQTHVGEFRLPHPLGLAAGFDKNARAYRELGSLGFSFVEVGTVTPKPQAGNPKPRIFRLAGQRALINRMGFNNDGAEAMALQIPSLPSAEQLILGVNIGKNKNTAAEHALDDYRICFERLSPKAHYVVINISSPNTPGLRDLAGPDFIKGLASFISPEERKRTWIKLDPDQSREHFKKTVETIAAQGFVGVVLTNTHRVEKPETGGLSGAPLAVRAAAHLEYAWEVHQGSLAMISSGGIFSGLDILERIKRGANAVQIYTALVYMGPLVVKNLLRQLSEEMDLIGCQSLEDIRGSHYHP